MKKVLFTEKQRLPVLFSGLILAMMVAVLAIASIEVIREDPEFMPWYLLIALFSIAAVSIVFLVAVEARITTDGLEYRVLPFPGKTIIIPKPELKLKLTELKGFEKFRWQGITYTRKRKYLLPSRFNLEIQHGNMTILIGTKKPRELKYILDNY